MTEIYKNSIFFVDLNKIKPNPYQPRQEFNDDKLADLAESIRQYGVLQPLIVARKEVSKEDGLETCYEIIAGERRWRASRLAGLTQVPVIIRAGDDEKAKLELAIIENLQREDLNAIERAIAFQKLINEFKLTHAAVGERIGKSREYVTNSLRLLSLPNEIQQAIIKKELSEGHARPLLMLCHKPEEQMALFRTIVTKRISVRAAERSAQKLAPEKIRKETNPEFAALEERLKETLGTRVKIEPKKEGTTAITIEFFSDDDLKNFLAWLEQKPQKIEKDAVTNFTI